MPDDVAVGGGGHALVHEAEPGVEADEPLLAGEHDAPAASGLCVGTDLPQNTGRTALPPMGRGGDDAEDHLPAALRRVEMGVVVHRIGEVGLVGDEAEEGKAYGTKGKAHTQAEGEAEGFYL